MASSSRDMRPTQDEDDDDKCEDDPEDMLPLFRLLRIGKQQKLKEEEEEEEEEEKTRKDSLKKRPLMRVKDYVKHCAVIKARIIDVGDIVWVVEGFPKRLWPGWVEKRGHRSATVSFFGSEEKSCKVRLSELYSFEEYFISVPQPISEELSYAIDCALEEFGRRFVLGVMCPCQISWMKKANDKAFMKNKKKNEFQPAVVLRFVLGRAVSAFVGHEKKLRGAKISAQVYTFRRFMYVLTDDENYRQEMRIYESGSSSTDDESEPDMRDNVASEEMSSEMVLKDSYKEKRTFSPPASDFPSEFQKEHFLNPATMPCALPLSVDGHLSSYIAQLQPSETSSRSEHPTSLHMKFPQDFKLHSKNELMMESKQFGKLDNSKTKAFIETDSAQVSFIQKLDAEAAFQYAKRDSTLFDGAKFWLDPHKDSTRGTTTTAPPLSFPTDGSSYAHGKEDKIDRNKGRCLPESQVSSLSPSKRSDGTCTPSRSCQPLAPPSSFPTVGSSDLKLKSCLRTPDAHGKEDETEPDILIPFLVLLLKCQQIVNALLGTKDKKGT